jgi:hypothetical protein
MVQVHFGYLASQDGKFENALFTGIGGLADRLSVANRYATA